MRRKFERTSLDLHGENLQMLLISNSINIQHHSFLKFYIIDYNIAKEFEKRMESNTDET